MPTPPTGLVTRTLAQIRSEIRQSIANAPALGPSVNTGSDSAVGQIIDIVALLISQNEEILQRLYDDFNRSQASGVQLESLTALIGVNRLPARASIVTVTATGTPGTVIPQGNLFGISGGNSFATNLEATIGPGGTVDIACTCTVTGPVQVPINSVEVIINPVIGLSSVTNNAAGSTGRNVETDQELRVRSIESLQASGQATVPAIRAALLASALVDACVVLTNRTVVDPDANGLPANSVKAIIWPDPGFAPADDEIFLILYDTAPAGIYVEGARSGDVTDSQNVPQTMRYSVASELVCFVDITVATDSSYPGDGDQQITDAIVAYGQTLSVGDILRIVQLTCASLIEGVVGVTALAAIGAPPGPGDNVDIVPQVDEIITIQAVNVVVNS